MPEVPAALAAVVVVEIKEFFRLRRGLLLYCGFCCQLWYKSSFLVFFTNIRIGCVNVLLKQTFVSKPGKPIQIPY